MIVGLLALAGLAVKWTRGDGAESWFDAPRPASTPATPLLALLLVYWIFALTTHLNIGHRHLLPIYPALCILAGGAAFWIQPLLGATRKAAAADRARAAAGSGRCPR